jgi:hypothetical protein
MEINFLGPNSTAKAWAELVILRAVRLNQRHLVA